MGDEENESCSCLLNFFVADVVLCRLVFFFCHTNDRGNWSLLNDAHIRYMDDTSRHTGRMVKSACASQAFQQLLAEHGGFGDSPRGTSRSDLDNPSSSSSSPTLEVGRLGRVLTWATWAPSGWVYCYCRFCCCCCCFRCCFYYFFFYT